MQKLGAIAKNDRT